MKIQIIPAATKVSALSVPEHDIESAGKTGVSTLHRVWSQDPVSWRGLRGLWFQLEGDGFFSDMLRLFQ